MASTKNRYKGIWEHLIGIVLSNLQYGKFIATMADGRDFTFTGKQPGPTGIIKLKDNVVIKRLVLGGGMGLAESYLDDQWETPNLEDLIEMAALNLSIKHFFQKLPNPVDPINTLLHRFRHNSRAGSKKNIEYHYDLGNDFYKLWLGKTMAYSSAIFESVNQKVSKVIANEPNKRITLEAAQVKNGSVCLRKQAQILLITYLRLVVAGADLLFMLPKPGAVR